MIKQNSKSSKYMDIVTPNRKLNLSPGRINQNTPRLNSSSPYKLIYNPNKLGTNLQNPYFQHNKEKQQSPFIKKVRYDDQGIQQSTAQRINNNNNDKKALSLNKYISQNLNSSFDELDQFRRQAQRKILSPMNRLEAEEQTINKAQQAKQLREDYLNNIAKEKLMQSPKFQADINQNNKGQQQLQKNSEQDVMPPMQKYDIKGNGNYFNCKNFEQYVNHMTSQIGKQFFFGKKYILNQRYDTDIILNDFRNTIKKKNEEQSKLNNQYNDYLQMKKATSIKSLNLKELEQQNAIAIDPYSQINVKQTKDPSKDYLNLQGLHQQPDGPYTFDLSTYKQFVNSSLPNIANVMQIKSAAELFNFVKQINNEVISQSQIPNYFINQKISFQGQQNVFLFQNIDTDALIQRIYIPSVNFAKQLFLPKFGQSSIMLLHYSLCNSPQGEYVLIYHKHIEFYQFIKDQLKTMGKTTEVIPQDSVFAFLKHQIEDVQHSPGYNSAIGWGLEDLKDFHSIQQHNDDEEYFRQTGLVKSPSYLKSNNSASFGIYGIDLDNGSKIHYTNDSHYQAQKEFSQSHMQKMMSPEMEKKSEYSIQKNIKNYESEFKFPSELNQSILSSNSNLYNSDNKLQIYQTPTNQKSANFGYSSNANINESLIQSSTKQLINNNQLGFDSMKESKKEMNSLNQNQISQQSKSNSPQQNIGQSNINMSPQMNNSQNLSSQQQGDASKLNKSQNISQQGQQNIGSSQMKQSNDINKSQNISQQGQVQQQNNASSQQKQLNNNQSNAQKLNNSQNTNQTSQAMQQNTGNSQMKQSNMASSQQKPQQGQSNQNSPSQTLKVSQIGGTNTQIQKPQTQIPVKSSNLEEENFILNNNQLFLNNQNQNFSNSLQLPQNISKNQSQNSLSKSALIQQNNKNFGGVDDFQKILTNGICVQKFGRKEGLFCTNPQKKIIHWTQDLKAFSWKVFPKDLTSSLQKSQKSKVFDFTHVKEICNGMKTENFQRYIKKNNQKEHLAFSIILPERSIDLIAFDEKSKSEYIQAIKQAQVYINQNSNQ